MTLSLYENTRNPPLNRSMLRLNVEVNVEIDRHASHLVVRSIVPSQKKG
jgi:hypothetical protein